MQVIMWHWNLTFVCGNRLLEWISTIYMHSLLIFPHVFFTLSLSSSLNVSCVCDKKILNKKFSNNIFFKRQLARREGFYNTTEKKLYDFAEARFNFSFCFLRHWKMWQFANNNNFSKLALFICGMCSTYSQYFC